MFSAYLRGLQPWGSRKHSFNVPLILRKHNTQVSRNRIPGSETREYFHGSLRRRPEVQLSWTGSTRGLDLLVIDSQEFLKDPSQPSALWHYQSLISGHKVAENCKNRRVLVFPMLGIKHFGGTCHNSRCLLQLLRASFLGQGDYLPFPLVLNIQERPIVRAPRKLTFL